MSSRDVWRRQICKNNQFSKSTGLSLRDVPFAFIVFSMACGDSSVSPVYNSDYREAVAVSSSSLSFTQSQVLATLGESLVIPPQTAIIVSPSVNSIGKNRGSFGKSWSTNIPALISLSAIGPATRVNAGNAEGDGLLTYSSRIGVEYSKVKIRAPEAIQSISFTDLPDTVAVGSTWNPYVLVREKSGVETPTRSVLWGTTDTTIASIETLKGFYFKRAGEVEALATAFGLTARKVVFVRSIAESATISVSAQNFVPGTIAEARASFIDHSGRPVSCDRVKWSVSPASGIVSINLLPDGLRVMLTAVAVGTATLNASCDNSPISSRVLTVIAGGVGDPNTPPPSGTASTGAIIASPSSTLHIGDSVLVDAQFFTASGAAIGCASVTWEPMLTGGAGVIHPHSGTQSASVVGLGVGSFVILAKCGNVVTAPKTLSIVAPAPPTQGGQSIALKVVRLDSTATGPVYVSGGLPLSQGRLNASDLNGVRLMLGDTEIPRYIAALNGRHPDGTIRSVLLQFAINVSDLSKPLRLEMVGRILPPLNRSNPRAEPIAIATPLSTDSLLASGIFGMTISREKAPTSPAFFQQYESDWVRYEATHYFANEDITEQQYYDRILAYFAFWARTGDPKYFARGAQLARRYRDEYIIPANYQLPEWSAVMDGYAIHYWLTGDELSRDMLLKVASSLSFSRGGEGLGRMVTHPWMDNRVQARVLGTKVLAIQLGATSLPLVAPYGVAVPDLRAAAASDLTLILSNQQIDGSYRSLSQCQESKNFMTGMLNGVLGAYYDYVSPDPRIQPAVQKSFDYLFNTQWQASRASFNYLSGTCPGQGGTGAAPDLNGLFLDGISWLYRQTNSATLRAYGDEVFRGGVQNSYLSGAKQFNQQYQMSWRWLGSRGAF